jgi:uncharacterized protein (TIGR03032 family)
MALADGDVLESEEPAHEQQVASKSSGISGESKNQFRVQTEFSRGLGDWLIDQQVGLVCSSYLTGYLLFIGVRANGMLVPSAASFSHAMGLVADSQRIYLGTKNEIWRLENILRPDELANDMFDRFYAPRSAHLTGDINIHEMGVDADGNVLFVNTRHSCLATISATHAFKLLWKPKFISRLAPEDRCHLNGLAMENGRARYVTACSTGDVLESWRGGKRDAGVLIDLDSDEIVADGFSMPHSPRVWNNSIYLLESGRGYLVRINRQSGKREDVTFCPGFGAAWRLCRTTRFVTVSLSRHANFGGLPIDATMKANGVPPRCGLLVIDLRNGDIVAMVPVQGRCHGIVRCWHHS